MDSTSRKSLRLVAIIRLLVGGGRCWEFHCLFQKAVFVCHHFALPTFCNLYFGLAVCSFQIYLFCVNWIWHLLFLCGLVPVAQNGSLISHGPLQDLPAKSFLSIQIYCSKSKQICHSCWTFCLGYKDALQRLVLNTRLYDDWLKHNGFYFRPNWIIYDQSALKKCMKEVDVLLLA